MTSYQTIRRSILDRISDGEWALGDLIPNEADLADEYSCARATVNRALRTLAEEGLLDRKRKGGTRIKKMPVRQARFSIPVIRQQVEQSGRAYSHEILARSRKRPPAPIRQTLKLAAGAEAEYLETMHYADTKPYALERRWINSDAIPKFSVADLSKISANEWLVQNVPFSEGSVTLFVTNADQGVAHKMDVAEFDPLFGMKRTTWKGDVAITDVELLHTSDYRVHISI